MVGQGQARPRSRTKWRARSAPSGKMSFAHRWTAFTTLQKSGTAKVGTRLMATTKTRGIGGSPQTIA